MIHEPLQGIFGALPPDAVARRGIEPHVPSGKKSHPFGRVALANAKNRTQVDRKSADSLLQYRAQQLALEGKRANEGVQTVKSIVSAVFILFQPARKPLNRL